MIQFSDIYTVSNQQKFEPIEQFIFIFLETYTEDDGSL